MESGFERSQSNNLPKVNMVMVLNFLASNNIAITETRQIKRSHSQIEQESYGDNAISFVQVKRDDQLCTLKARISPKQDRISKSYQCTLICNEATENILSVTCKTCDLNNGSCKHTIALVMWLNRRTEEPSSSSIKCYWKKKAKPIESDLKFMKTADLFTPSGNTLPEAPVNNGSYLQEIVKKSQELNINTTLMQYHKVDKNPTLSIHSMACHYIRQGQPLEADSFMVYCKNNMEQIGSKTTHDTMNDTEGNSWCELRYGRITASKLQEIAVCDRENEELVEYILGAYSFLDRKKISRGKRLKPKILHIVAEKLKINIEEGGFILNKKFPTFGVMLDGISEEFVLEIKHMLGKKNIENYVKDGEITEKYMAQIQLQMLFTNKRSCLFCVAHKDFETSKNVEVYIAKYDKKKCFDLMERSLSFWKKYIFKRVLML